MVKPVTDTVFNGVFKFRIRWKAYRDAWVLETEHHLYAPSHWKVEEPTFNLFEIAFGFRALWRRDRAKTYWDAITLGDDVEELKKRAAEYVAECVSAKRKEVEAAKRAAANKETFEFVLTATVIA